MTDPRLTKLAEQLLHYSVKIRKGEKVLIQATGTESEPLVLELIKETYKRGAMPFIKNGNERISRELLKNVSDGQLKMMAENDLSLMEQMDVYIGFSAQENSSETSDVPPDRMRAYMELYLTPVHFDRRVNHTRWVVLRYPTSSMAQDARMSTEAFENFYFKVCNLDYSRLSKAMDPLTDLMNKSDKVRITGPGTDLLFSIKDIPAVKCHGDRNIPDGEVYTAPVKDSVNGTLSYNCPAVYQGVTYENIKLEFKNGRIVRAESSDTARINKVFDTDEGARYIGEFALGVNPYVDKPMRNALFDEKIAGSFHFTPGRCYEEAPNGNNSAIHWDLVCLQTPEYGGGEIYFDDRLIRKDGLFTVPELEALNPDKW